MSELVLGAVAYDAKVVPIWDGFKAYFESHGLPFDFVLYSNYERQVAAHLRGEIDVAWNSPLAWIQTRRAAPDRARAIAMRDTDRDLTSVVLVRATLGPGGSGPGSGAPVQTVADLRAVGVGARDSPQATLIPLLALADAGARVEVVPHDVLVGKHGDHVGGERDAVKALLAGKVDAACVIDGNRLAFAREGLFAPNQLRVLVQTAPYDHCNVTALADTPAIAKLRELLLAMSYDDPVVRPLLDMEGLTRWLPGRTSGYALLEHAVDA
ncbi:MAG TPA: PhnD/SsuA/transferrin family substrate-binding protein [Kofleriaceae bacterium]